MSVTDKVDKVNRKNDVRKRLQNAALRLFQQHGYERTTAAAIAAQAGVTERTFFRHFTDKREVLFAGEATLRDALVAAIEELPDDLDPVASIFAAFGAVRPLLEGNREFAKPRYALINATPALNERELAKLEQLSAALTTALEQRRVPKLRATLAARVGMAAFAQAVALWLDDPQVSLSDRFDEALMELKSL